MVKLPLVDPEECKKRMRRILGLKKFDSKYQICAGGDEGKDSCSGDSGSPLMKLNVHKMDSGDVKYSYVLIGMVSYGGEKCGLKGKWGVYTRVESYTDWVLDNLSSKCIKIMFYVIILIRHYKYLRFVKYNMFFNLSNSLVTASVSSNQSRLPKHVMYVFQYTLTNLLIYLRL